MVRWIHARSRCVGAALLLSLGPGPLLVSPHGVECHDAECAATYIAHDESAHRMRAELPDDREHPGHCAICHWARSFSPGRQPTHHVAIPAEHKLHVSRSVAGAPLVFPAAEPPLRSPPTSPVLG
jgi:hypothetical protein